jgi:hypothetical protein
VLLIIRNQTEQIVGDDEVLKAVIIDALKESRYLFIILVHAGAYDVATDRILLS